MRVIVLGCGRVGGYLANFLAEHGHHVTVIDKNPAAFRILGNDFVVERVREVGRGGEESEAEKTFTAHTHICCVIGTGVDDDILRNAGIEKAEAFAAVTDSDYINIMAALIAKEIYHVHKVIAGIVNPRRLKITQELGLEAICPLTLGAQHIFDALVKK